MQNFVHIRKNQLAIRDVNRQLLHLDQNLGDIQTNISGCQFEIKRAHAMLKELSSDKKDVLRQIDDLRYKLEELEEWKPKAFTDY